MTLISAVVPDDNPTHIILTFPNPASLIAADFSITGYPIESASWTGSVLTLTSSRTIVWGDELVLTFLRTGDTVNIDNQVGGWLEYWSNQPGVLFLGLMSDLSGGQIPNRVLGSSDYLTVSGLSGEETFQCPNTPQYIAADTDFIWFKTDQTRRVVTTAELIGYDLQRTPVRYDDDSPNSIRAIMIRDISVDPLERDRLFTDLLLPFLWDNDYNEYGRLKSNRTGQNLWTPEAVYEPEVLTYISGLATPLSEAQLTRINTLVLDLKSGLSITNLSDYFDVFALSAGETSESSLKNLVKNSHHGVLGGTAPSFVALEGFKAATSLGYINSSFNPLTQGVRFTEQNNAVGFYVRDDVVVGSTKTIAGNGTNSRVMLRYTGDVVRGSNNGFSVGNLLSANSATRGFYLVRRIANVMGISKNGAAFSSLANNAAALTGYNYYILGDNNADVFRYGTDNQVSCYLFSKAPSDAESIVINNAIEAYMDANSKGIQ